MRRCGKCQAFVRMKNLEGSSGLCEIHDCRVWSDNGRKCKFFKAIKYERITNRKDSKNAITEATNDTTGSSKLHEGGTDHHA